MGNLLIYTLSFLEMRNLRKIQHQIETLLEKVIYAPSLQRFLNRTFRTSLFRAIVKVSLQIMGKTFGYSINDYNTYAIALSHLDAAWLWTIKDSKFRAYKTFHMAIDHILKYPYFSISLTSPQYFEWIKRYDAVLDSPAHPMSLWEATKKYVVSGKV